jgi:radical SAM superfamily enzyme YgiQ (UPF0313 family)
MVEPYVGLAIQNRIQEVDPEVIGISVRNIDDQNSDNPRFLLEKVQEVVGECRSGSNAPIVLGGAGYSIFPDAVLGYLDADLGVCGDGEVAFPALLDCLQRGENPARLPGVHVAGHAGHAPIFPGDLDTLPLPEDELWSPVDPSNPQLWVPVQGRRGCPNACSYCATFRIQGRAIRLRSPRAVAEHVSRVARVGFCQFYFVDNSFNKPEEWALELCRHLREMGTRVAWRCILYPQHVSEKLVEAMAETGCVEVALGFESGCIPVLQRMNKRFVPDEVRHISNLLAAHGIRRMGFLLLGGPGETRRSVEESLSFAESLQLEQLRITVGIRMYPGTPLQQCAIEEGFISPQDDLLHPKFYLAPGLDPWIRERVSPCG